MLLLPLLAQLTISVSAPDTVAVLEPIVVTVEMTANGSRPPRLIPPDFRGFSVGRTSASTSVENDAAGSRVRVDIRYVLEASRPGDYLLQPFEARLGGDAARSRAMRIVVRGPTSAAVPPIVTEAPFDAAAPVSVAATLTPDTVYVGEQFTYQVAVFVDETVRNRLRRTPGFAPPELRGMLAYDLSPMRGILPTRRVGDRRYEPHLYQRAIFPLVAGRHLIPSAELQYSLPLSYSFFSREESRVLRTDSLVVVALDVPDEGRPPDYRGAVGELSMTAAVEPEDARVGDPAVLTLTVSGIGNVKMLPRPEITLPWADLVPAQERVTVDWSSETISGSKEFDWVITPHVAGDQILPPLPYSFFNPRTEQYEVAFSQPETLGVAPGALIAAAEAAPDTVPLLPLRTTYRGEPGPPLHTRPGYWLLLAAVPVPALFTAVARRPRRRKVPSAATILRALKSRKTKLTAGEVRRAWVNALAQRLHLTAGALSTRTEFARALRRAGVSSQTTDSAVTLLGELDDAAYGTRPAAMSGLLARAQESYRAVDAEARATASPPIPPAALALAITFAIGAAAAAIAASPEEEGVLFQRGAEQYAARQFVAAEHSFAEVTRLAPDAPDAWANFGTAAWAARDTSAAVVGWHRALRLEPLASDVRGNLALVRAPRIGTFAWVPPVPTEAVVVLIAALWVGAWLLALLRAAGWRVVSRGGAIAAGLGAMSLAVVAMVLDEHIAGRRLAVVGETTMLRALPALGAEPLRTVRPGDVVRGLGRRGEWSLVELETGQEGWIEAPVLVPIARD